MLCIFYAYCFSDNQLQLDPAVSIKGIMYKSPDYINVRPDIRKIPTRFEGVSHKAHVKFVAQQGSIHFLVAPDPPNGPVRAWYLKWAN